MRILGAATRGGRQKNKEGGTVAAPPSSTRLACDQCTRVRGARMASILSARGRVTATVGMEYVERNMTDPLLKKPGAANVGVAGDVRKEVDVSGTRNGRIGRAFVTRVAVACALPGLVILASCRPRPIDIPGKARDPRALPGATDERVERPEPTASSKRVAAKQPPNTLIAEDRTQCVVPESRYERTRIGDLAYCTWT